MIAVRWKKCEEKCCNFWGEATGEKGERERESRERERERERAERERAERESEVVEEKV